MIIQNQKRCKVKITRSDEGKFFLLISQKDGFHCQVAELTAKQANMLAEYIRKNSQSI